VETTVVTLVSTLLSLTVVVTVTPPPCFPEMYGNGYIDPNT